MCLQDARQQRNRACAEEDTREVEVIGHEVEDAEEDLLHCCGRALPSSRPRRSLLKSNESDTSATLHTSRAGPCSRAMKQTPQLLFTRD